MALRLDRVRVGQTVKVIDFCTFTQPLRQKLLAMGVIPGVSIKVLRLAPLGDPIQISLRGYTLSLRKHECQQIIVEPIQTQSTTTQCNQGQYGNPHACACR